MYRTKQMTGKKALAWKWFSKYIRLRDAINTTGDKEYVQCITCKKIIAFNKAHAGHMIPGRTNSILFDESIVHAQCRKCNCEGSGEQQMYKYIMIQKHSEDWYDMKVAARKKPSKISESGFALIAEEYKTKYNNLLNKC